VAPFIVRFRNRYQKLPLYQRVETLIFTFAIYEFAIHAFQPRRHFRRRRG